MKNKKYKIYSFRLNDITLKELKKIKGNQTWNWTFWQLIKNREYVDETMSEMWKK